MKDHLKLLVYNQASNLVKFKLGIMLTGWNQKGNRMFKQVCICKEMITQNHAMECDRHKDKWQGLNPKHFHKVILNKWQVLTTTLVQKYSAILDKTKLAIIKAGKPRQRRLEDFFPRERE